MKKHYYILLLLVFWNCTINGQHKYNKLWTKVERLELTGKTRFASKEIDKIIRRAKRDNNQTQIIKSFLYKAKYQLLLEEDAESNIYKILFSEIKSVPFPTKNILESILAKNLENYLDNNAYKIRNRTTTDTIISTDHRTWDINTLNKQIHQHYQNSLDQSSELIKIRDVAFSEILKFGDNDEKYRNTLYDLLANRAISYYNTSNHYAIKDDTYRIAPYFYSIPSVFTNKSVGNDTISSSVKNTLELYQNIEKAHIVRNDSLSVIHTALDRLEFLKRKNLSKDSLYFNALKNLQTRYTGESRLPILLDLASYYKNAMDISLHPDYNEKALQICNQIMKEAPSSIIGTEALQLKKLITNPSLSITTENFILPNKKSRALINYKNIDSIHISFYKVPFNYLPIKDSYYAIDSLITDFTKNQIPVRKASYELPKNQYHLQRSTEIILPELKPGKYLIIVQKDLDTAFESNIYGINYIQATSLSLISASSNKKNSYQVLDRHSGSPIKGAKILLQDTLKGHSFFKKLTTNNKGIAKINLGQTSHRLNTVISKDTDSLFLDTSINRRYEPYRYRNNDNDNDNDNDFTAKAKIFTDRSIYRPGQKIYFKGILTQRKNKTSSPVSGEYVTIILYDANQDEIKELRLKTNEFGSVHGEFTLPTNKLNGEFIIEMDEDYDEDSKFWEDLYYFEIAEHTIRVEEYKRPRFEIKFDKITETYTLNDSIKIKGTAKAFLGAAISNVPVNYTITREKSYQLPYNNEEAVIKGNVTTDQQGDFVIDFIANTNPKATPTDRPIFRYRIDTEITDVNGETRNETQYIRVGYHSLEANILMDQIISSEKNDTKLYINIKTLNNYTISYKGSISIYKLKHPDRILRKRPWDIPDIQQIPKDTFSALFPNDAYDIENKNQYDENDIIGTYTVNTEEDDKISLGNIKDWKGGKYIVKFHTKDEFGYNITAEQQFMLTNPKEKYLADNQLFSLTINDDHLDNEKRLQINLKTAATSLFVNVEAYQKSNIIFNDVVEIKNGQYSIPIHVKQRKDPISVQVSFIKYNCIWTDQRNYHFIQHIQKADLTIELETFRNKLQPGIDETWKLKILNSNGEPAAAEILASMYDMSLDTFINHGWSRDIKILEQKPYYQNDLPRIDTQTSFRNVSLWIKNLQAKHYRPYVFTYNTINTFGFNVSNPERSHKNYLNTLYYNSSPSQSKIGKRLKASGGTITGLVRDDQGLPLPGVNIIIKGTSIGVISDFDGLFTIEAQRNDILIFSFIGFISSEIKVHNNQATITMQEDASELDQVVVVGYGTQMKKSLTASLSTITSEEINSPYSEILQGKVAGIKVLSAAGVTPSSVVNIRGYSSFKNDTKVLIVVDGVPFLKGQQSLSTLDLADIQVLKGAAAKAIYGNKASNGVIIITTKKGIEELQNVVPRKNLKETAFFFPQLQTNKKGEISFNFTSPEALTRWKFQALAYDKRLHTQLIQSEVITQKELNIVPNIPRFLREGDTITISAKIANLDVKKMKGLVSLSLTDEISQSDLKMLFIDNNNVQNFAIDARGNTSVSWKLHIPKSLQAIRYRIVAKAGKYSDGEESIIPVLTNRILVTESVPIWVRPGEQKTFGFSKMNDQSSATRQQHQITLEYSTNPAWFAIKSIPYLMEYPYECAEQTFAKYYSNAIASHILNSNPKIKKVFESWKAQEQLISNLEKNQELKNILIQETPWVRNAQSEKEQRAKLAELFDLAKISIKQEASLEKLQELQDTSGGFPWFNGGNVNPYITRHILSGLGHLKKINVNTENIGIVDKIAKKAITFLDKKYLENYKTQFDIDSNYYFSRNDLHYFYARSFWKEKFPVDKKIDSIYNQHIPKEHKNWMQIGLFDKTILALILQRNGDQKIAQDIINTLTENAVISPENGMYWKENKPGWHWYQSPIELQALIIEAFSEISGDNTTINELKTWLLKNKQLQSWSTTKATTEAIYALLLQGSDWLSVEEGAEISFGTELNPEKLLPINNTEAGTGYFKKQWSSNEISKTMDYVTVQNKSKVPQYGGYYWQYFENLDKITSPTEDQIRIKKELFMKQNTDEKMVLNRITDNQQLAIGNLITVRVELTIKNNFEFVHMKDMRASGLEPINVISQYKYQDGLGYYESTKDASTNFFFDYLPKGVYVFEYDLRVNNKGDFSNGITTIQSMYAPEFTSHSEGIRVKIK